jgi:hypothetical protein
MKLHVAGTVKILMTLRLSVLNKRTGEFRRVDSLCSVSVLFDVAGLATINHLNNLEGSKESFFDSTI